MGSCLSSPNSSPSSTEPRIQLSNKTRTLSKSINLNKDLVWLSEAPVNKAQTLSDRAAFWETADVYSGKKLIWDTLKSALEAEDEEFAKLLISSANIIVPTMQLKDGCYDEQGERYVIPNYCFSLPANVIVLNPDNTSIHIASDSDLTSTVEISSSTQLEIVVRLNSGKDLNVFLSETDSLPILSNKVLQKLNLNKEDTSIKFIYRGKIIQDNLPLISSLDLKPNYIVQALLLNL
ncbi:hypothetical protein BB561_004039 [Smittium simulii]|uniref:Ubiquitin-like domain-containing protein n=1 Tax=Smittium simulii TaxID=133385 RepID=A0A2T9YIC1_9FUNG|nr:hypothetical protein BB561_004039 [Smittium simulii]